MSDELEVTVSGEGDFSMTTDSAWRVEIGYDQRTTIIVTNDGGPPRIEILGAPVKVEHFPVEQGWQR